MQGIAMCALVGLLAVALVRADQAPPQGPLRFRAAVDVRAQQVLRAGAHLVQVDAYPLRDGKPIVGLTAADFEVLEDGKPQQIDSVRFLEFPIWTPDGARRDPSSQQESFERAADPANRLFVVYLNRMSWQLGNYVEPALVEFLDRSLGERDYVGIMTQMQSPGDIVFGQETSVVKGEIARFLDIVDHMDPRYMTDAELEVFACFGGGLIERWRADDVYRDLEGLIAMLGGLRETRSTLIFVSETMVDPSGNRGLTATAAGAGRRIVPPGQRLPPPSGRGSFERTHIESNRCEDLRKAALEPWAPDRFRKLVAQARAANVALNPINPRGLVSSPDMAVIDEATANDELMRTMANETGGLAMVTTNDMHEAFRRVAGTVDSHYLLGYYSSNRNADGRIRRITVKLRPSGETIRSRREYRAPSPADLAPPPTATPPAPGAPSGPPEGLQAALSDLERNERVAGEPSSSDDQVVPRISRAPSPPAAPWQPAPLRRFSRTERVRFEWPLPSTGGDAATFAVRLLDKEGRALPLIPVVTHSNGVASATMALSPLAAGIYVIEAVLPDGAVQFTAFRVG